MDTNKKPLVGIDLGIDPEYLENVIKTTVISLSFEREKEW